MKISILILFLFSSSLFAQGKFSVKTDKSEYNYGETITITCTILNDSDTSFTIWGSSSCRATIGFDSVFFFIPCTADYSPLEFPKYSSQSWVWELDPTVYGIPTTNGEHIVYGNCYQMKQKDSVIIKAPKYYGGYVYIYFRKETSEDAIELLRDSLNAENIYRHISLIDSSIDVTWKTYGYSIDSLKIAYENDPRIEYFFTDRWISGYDRSYITSAEHQNVIENRLVLEQNYPNPFNPSTTITYSIPENGFVSLKIYDALGREIKTLVNKEQTAGNYKIVFYSNELSSGIYFYRIETKNYVETKKMIFIK